MQIKTWHLVILVILIVAVVTSLGALDFLSPTGSFRKGPMFLLEALYISIFGVLYLVVRNWRKRRIWFPYFASMTLAFVAVLEICLRFFHPAHATAGIKFLFSPRLHHVMPRNDLMVMPVPGTNHYIRFKTDELGLRNDYSRQDFMNHELRIVTLGDSFTFGAFVEDEQVFPRIIEKQLGEIPGVRDVAILNAGVISYSPLIERILFESELKNWNPNLVILVLDATDIGDDYAYAKTYQQSEPGKGLFRREGVAALLPAKPSILSNLAIYERTVFMGLTIKALLLHPIFTTTRDVMAQTTSISINGIEKERNRFFIYRHPLEQTEPYFRATLGHINEIARLARSVGAGFLLVITPRFNHWNKHECPKNWEATQYTDEDPFQFEYFRFFEEVRESVDYEIVNLLPVFQESTEFPLVFDSDPHWNPAGHRLVASSLVDYLVGSDLLPTGRPLESRSSR